MSGLRKQIEKLSYDKLPFRYGEKYVKTADVLNLLADCVCIPKKQLEAENDKAKQYLADRKKLKLAFGVTRNIGYWEGYLQRGKELLEESK